MTSVEMGPIEQERALYDEIVRRIVAVADLEKIIVFGSRARGDHRPDSDIDILVIKDSAEPQYMRSRGLYGALSDIIAAMDIVVYTPDEVREWRGASRAFVTTAVREGKVLYERQPCGRARLDNESGERPDSCRVVP